MKRLASIGIAALFAAGALVIMAVAIGILDIYLSGHGYQALAQRAVIDDPGSGTHLSVADVLVLAASALAALLGAWWSWPRRE